MTEIEYIVRVTVMAPIDRRSDAGDIFDIDLYFETIKNIVCDI